jgi:hypothetical protein
LFGDLLQDRCEPAWCRIVPVDEEGDGGVVDLFHAVKVDDRKG